MDAEKKLAHKKTDSGGAKDRFWEVRIWNGMTAGPWFRELWRNRCRVGLTRIPMALTNSFISLINSGLWAAQSVFLNRKIARTELQQDPVFVLGHWRSGTTLLHELLVSDPRHSYPDTYACFAPNHFIFSRRFFAWWLSLLLPKKRPMDEMKVGWDSPQEDEWALCSMGVPSPYLTLMFPNQPMAYPEYLDLREVPPAALERWKSTLKWYLQCLTVQRPGRMVLKTPQHTCRIPVLLDMFPKARFVHILRDPYVIFPSTMKLWKRMYRYHGMQTPRFEGLEDRVFDVFNHMDRVFEEDRQIVPPGQFCQIRYEDLVKDPLGQMRRMYSDLELGDFENVRPGVEAYIARTKDYKVNRHDLTPELRDEITRRWRPFIERYGYTAPRLDGEDGASGKTAATASPAAP